MSAARTTVNEARPLPPSAAAPPRHLPTLDGLRAISIALVMFAHLLGTHGFPSWPGIQLVVGDLGSLGVRVFFVLSGFLITHLLLEEQRRHGQISLVDFYARRAIRILPALATFLIGMFIAEQLGWLNLVPGDWLHALTFTMDYSPHPGWPMGHLWSLSVEEQFYLVWPALLVLLGVRRALGVAAAVVIVVPVIRVLLWFVVPHYRDYMDLSFETVADALAIGCLLAGTRTSLAKRRLYLTVIGSRFFVFVPILVFLTNGQEPHPVAFMLVGETLMNVGIAMIIDWSLRNHAGRIGHVLDSKPARLIGTRSYSLYLWQEPFLNHRMGALATSFPLNVVLAGIAAVLSFALVEKPFARLRTRFSR
jgi:peptidoglycan/LPS O-acetylase OafA/YrhL